MGIEVTANRYRISSSDAENVLEFDSGEIYTTL